MYHLRAIYVLAFLLNCSPGLLEAHGDHDWKECARRCSSMCHPDGRIALLNDSAFGIYNEPLQLTEFVGRVLGESSPSADARSDGPFELPEAGYYGFRGRDGSYVICDAGAIGPDYLPGHAHGDIFSFEMSLRGRRVIVDSGVFDYETSDIQAVLPVRPPHTTPWKSTATTSVSSGAPSGSPVAGDPTMSDWQGQLRRWASNSLVGTTATSVSPESRSTNVASCMARSSSG